jgi:Mg-chelatase subunit ChlD/anti-sigma factor RsiW
VLECWTPKLRALWNCYATQSLHRSTAPPLRRRIENEDDSHTPMNDQRPTDPREQMEVRITALLLGEASPFEEAELLEAIKHDPALAAYYEEMRQMVKRVEETIQLTPFEAATTHPTLSEERRGKLEALFKQPAPAKTIKLDSQAGRARRLGRLQHAAAIAAALVILLVAAGLLLPSLAKSKAKASRIAALNEAKAQELASRIYEDDQKLESVKLWLNRDLLAQDDAVAGSRQFQVLDERQDSIGSTRAGAGHDVEGDERFVARYGLSQVERRKSLPMNGYMTTAEPAQPRNADIYLPSASLHSAGVPVQTPAAGAERGLAADSTARFYFGDEREDSVRNSDFAQTAAGATDSQTPAFSVPEPSAVLPGQSQMPIEYHSGSTFEFATGSLAGKGVAAPESKVVLGKKLAAPPSAPPARSEGEELRPVIITGSLIPSSEPITPSGPANSPAPTVELFGSLRTRVKSVPMSGIGNQAHAANTWSADFGAIAARPEVESFGRGVVADDYVANGQVGQVATELFAKQQADTKSVERLERRGGETSLGLAGKEANVPAEPMYEERLLTEQRQLDREPVEELGKRVAVRAIGDLDQVRLRAGLIAADGEDKRLLKGLSDQLAERGEATKEQLEREAAALKPVQRGVADYDDSTLRNELLSLLRERQESEDKVRLNELNETAFDTQSRFDTLADLSGAKFALESEPEWLGALEQPDLKIEAVAEAVRREADPLLVRQKLADAKSASRQGDLEEATRLYGDAIRIGERVEGVVDVELQEARQGLAKVKVNETTRSRFDTLADFSSSEFALATDNGREKQIEQLVASAPIAAPEVTQLAEEAVESQPAIAQPPASLEPLPEIRTADHAFSTFSLNVSDVSFQLAASSLENGQMPDGARLRSEEFINAFDYRDPMPAPGQRVAFNWERARNPFAHNRELLRFSVQTAAAGREPGQPLNLVLLLDNSGSMERADRVQITGQMLRVLAAGLNDYDRVSVISFARTPRLIVDGLPGGNHQALLDQITSLNPDGGTNLEDALKLGYETAAKHFQAAGNNRVILITDGAANLGNVDPAQLRERVIDQRKRGIALDCFGVGWEGYNDNLLESLSRNGDGRYGFLNDAVNAPAQFASQLAGALQVAAADVKAQVEFNPNRVTVYRQIGYQQHQLTKEQFRDNTVDAAEIGAAEAGNALYSVEVNPNGSGPIGTFRARYRVPSTGQYEEKEWVLDYTPAVPELEKSGPAMRLASSSAAFAEWLANSPYAQTVTPDALQNLLRGVPETFAPDPRPVKLQAMIQQARAISGR